MGLDMYLRRRSYIKNWDHQESKHSTVVKKDGKKRTDIKSDRVAYIIEEAAYWRKANAIHKWFVDNCQDGVDDCREAYVSREQLKELVDLCKQVLESVETVEGEIHNGTSYSAEGVVHHMEPGKVVAQPGIAKALLPTASGFFFGNTDYDQYYLDDIRDTIKQLEPLVEEGDIDGVDYQYHSSW